MCSSRPLSSEANEHFLNRVTDRVGFETAVTFAEQMLPDRRKLSLLPHQGHPLARPSLRSKLISFNA
jgi:hypothetical protein